jgi:hypothetical protein
MYRANSSSAYVIKNLWDGVFATGGGVAEVSGATVANNSRNGVFLYNGGTAHIAEGAVVQSSTNDGVHAQSGNVEIGAGTAATIQSNGKNGVFLGTNSVGSFGSASNQIINNGGWGILCAGSPSDPLGNGNPGTVSGNTAGQIACNFGN